MLFLIHVDSFKELERKEIKIFHLKKSKHLRKHRNMNENLCSRMMLFFFSLPLIISDLSFDSLEEPNPNHWTKIPVH